MTLTKDARPVSSSLASLYAVIDLKLDSSDPKQEVWPTQTSFSIQVKRPHLSPAKLESLLY